MNTKIQLMMLLLLSFGFSNAQQAIDASGGDAIGTNGKVSYSIGQVAYVSATGSNGSVSQGVQQPFEIFTLGTDHFPTIILQALVYPNPTSANVILKMENYSLENASIQLYDIQGRTVIEQKISQNETSITMENLAASNYILQVLDNKKPIKSFKIIKN